MAFLIPFEIFDYLTHDLEERCVAVFSANSPDLHQQFCRFPCAAIEAMTIGTTSVRSILRLSKDSHPI